ncbi:helix-turn-helix domain-containing protein [Paenibacillus rigui]|nr:helix-turn-helix domain-containing protein [Paenibacillus rigui]
MTVLTETESEVYKQLKRGKGPNEIGQALKRSKSYIFQVLTYLVKRGLAQKTDKKPYTYTAIHVEYTICIRHPGGPGRAYKGRRGIKRLKIIMRLIGKENLRFILNHRGKMDRRKIAEKVGIRKYDLNNIYLLLGLSGEEAA